MVTGAAAAVGAVRAVMPATVAPKAAAQLLYAGDSVGGESWDHRDWSLQRSIRKSLFFLACDACCDAPGTGTGATT